MMSVPLKFYRYETHVSYHTCGGVDCRLLVFDLVKETPKGYWIIPEDTLYFMITDKLISKKWVSKIGRKRYAYPTKKEALISYKARSNIYLDILKQRIYNVKRGLECAKFIEKQINSL